MKVDNYIYFVFHFADYKLYFILFINIKIRRINLFSNSYKLKCDAIDQIELKSEIGSSML